MLKLLRKKLKYRWLFSAFYIMFSVYLWLVKRWVTNGDMGDMKHYMTIIYGILFSVAGGVICPIKKKDAQWKIRDWILSRKRVVALAVLAAYYGFAIVAYNALFYFSIKGLVKVCLYAVWAFIQLALYIWFFEKIKCIVKVNRVQAMDKYLFWKLFIIAFLCWNLIYQGVWPGGLPYDANLEIDTALGNVPFSSYQPFIHVYIVRFALWVGNHISLFFFLQIALEAMLLSGLFSFFHNKCGIKKKWIYSLFMFLVFYPPVFSLGMELLRDPIFSFGFAWMTFLLVNYKKESIEIKGYYLQLFAAYFLVSTMRSNGIAPMIVLFPVFLYIGIKADRKLCAVAISVVAFYGLINGPIASVVGVEKYTKTNFAIEAAIDGMMSVKYYNGSLPEGAEDYMEKIKRDDVDGWDEGYNEWQYHGNYDFTNGSTGKTLKLYFETFLKNPYMIIRNRLIKCSAIWEIFGHDERLVYRYLSVETKEGTYYFYLPEEGELTSFVRGLWRFSVGINADFLTYRSGFSLVLIFLMLIYSSERKRIALATIPIFANIIALAYALGYHESRYIYWIVLCCAVLFLFEIFEDHANDCMMITIK